MPKISELATGTVTSAGKIAVAQGSTTIQATVADVVQGSGLVGGGGVPVKGTSGASGGFGLPGELTGIRIEYAIFTGNNSTDGSITIQYNDSTGTARAFKLIGNGVSGVTAGSVGDTSN